MNEKRIVAIDLLCGHTVHYRQHTFGLGSLLYCSRCEDWRLQRLMSSIIGRVQAS